MPKEIVFLYSASVTGIEGLKKRWKTLMKGKETSPGIFDTYVSKKEHLKRRPPTKQPISKGEYHVKSIK